MARIRLYKDRLYTDRNSTVTVRSYWTTLSNRLVNKARLLGPLVTRSPHPTPDTEQTEQFLKTERQTLYIFSRIDQQLYMCISNDRIISQVPQALWEIQAV